MMPANVEVLGGTAILSDRETDPGVSDTLIREVNETHGEDRDATTAILDRLERGHCRCRPTRLFRLQVRWEMELGAVLRLSLIHI